MIQSDKYRSRVCNRIAILGSGHAGRGLAGYLSLRGFDVSLYNRTAKNIAGIMKRGGLDVHGIEEGFAPVSIATDDMSTAIKDREILIVTVPAHAHGFYASTLAPYLQTNHTILLMPGRTGGALEFARIIGRHINPLEVCLGEAQTFSFVSRATGSSSVRISKIKNRLRISAFPVTNNRRLMRELRELPLPLVQAENVLETSLDNIGAMLHPAPTILCAGLLESQRGGYNHYHDGISESIGKLIEKMDAERVEIAERFAVDSVSLLEWLQNAYDATGETLCECIRSIDAYNRVGSPASLKHRYVLEDVPTGLVPLSYFGDMAGIVTPAMDAVINMACQLYDIDFWRTGRTLSKMGLSRMMVQEVIEYVHTGLEYEEEPSLDALWHIIGMEVE